MRLWRRLAKFRRWLGWDKGSEAASRVLVSVYVQSRSMTPRGLSRASRRILLTTSIWSVLALVFIFFVTYTVLLKYVDPPFQRTSTKLESFHGMPSDQARPRFRFLGRGHGSRNSSSLLFSSDQRTQFWNPAELDDPASDLPRCQRGSLFIVLITSSPDHFEHRREIRNTWCSPKLSSQDDSRWLCVFLVGQTNDTETSFKLKQESQSKRDILRGSYIDSYRNLTRKVMHGLSWVSSQCEAPYVLKTDDDCFVNTVLLRHFLLHDNTHTTSLYAGSMMAKKERRKVIRAPNEKWSVSRDDYFPDYYPMYASGSGYTLSFDVVMKAVEESKYTKPIPNEDAYIGILMEQLGVLPTLSGRFILTSVGLRLCNYLYLFVAHGVIPAMHQDMYNNMVNAQLRCRSTDDVNDWY